jgi:tetratricopeptide (TPR) repeat protein
MSKQKVILLAATAMFIAYSAAYAVPTGPFGYDLQADIHRSENKTQEENADNNAEATEEVDLTPKTAKDLYSFVPMADLFVPTIDSSKYYPNASLKSAIYKYKVGNYTGCLQELYSFIKNPKNVNNAYAYYYMGLAYSKIGESTAAQNAFQKTINCDAKGKLLELAAKGRDCISGGPYCQTPVNPNYEDLYRSNPDSLDAFIYAPYSGNGLSPQAQRELKQRELNNMQKKLNRESEKKN